MRKILLFLLIPVLSSAQNHTRPVINISPLSGYSSEWNDPKYLACNTAAKANYMTPEEKKVIYILNLVRMNPGLFCGTVVKKYPETSVYEDVENSTYYKSLVTTLNDMGPLNLLLPDKKCFTSAQCHAFNSGQNEYVGHDRTGNCASKQYFNGECCSYGYDKALDIVMSLLVDYDVPSLGHRYICFSKYNTLGVSIQPHKTWTHNAVLDFHF